MFTSYDDLCHYVLHISNKFEVHMLFIRKLRHDIIRHQLHAFINSTDPTLEQNRGSVISARFATMVTLTFDLLP